MAHMTRPLCAVLLAAGMLAGCGGNSGPMAIPADAQKTPSGISWIVLKPGTGTQHPSPASTVLVHYTGWTMDGKEFDSSLKQGKPLAYPINRFIPGWTEGLQLMVKGEKRKFWIPAKLAYEGMEGRPQGMLVFEVELIDFK
jgi:FKBP-type peptidyl-prolyl cis-trans isomerase